MLERIQAGTQHVGYGKTPTKEKIEQQIQELRTAMQQAIAEERFEDAAHVMKYELEHKLIKEGEENA